MRNLPNINLSWIEFYDITENQVFTDTDGESIICTTNKPNTLYKFFVNPYTRQLIDMPDNKYKKIIVLYQYDLEYSIKILSTVSAGGYLVGYEMSYRPENIPFLSLELSKKETLAILRRVKQGLDYYHRHNIVYGDIKGNNILLDLKSGQIEFCDLDNMQIGEYPMDVKGPTLTNFVKEYGKVDRVADIYMYNLFTLKKLNFPTSESTYRKILTTLENGIYPEMVNDSGRRILKRMLYPRNFTGDSIIPYIKK